MPVFSDMIIYCKIISDVDGFRHLKSEWNNLLSRSAATSFFLTHEYLWTWWNVYGADYKLRIVTARDEDGNLIGVAPMMIGASDNNKRQFIRHLVFIGGLGDTLSEDQDFIVNDGDEMAVVPRLVQVLLERLAGEWDLMQLGMVSSESPCLARLGGAIDSLAGELQCVQRHVAPYAILPPTWEAYLATRCGKFRSGFNRRARKLECEHHVEFLTAGRDIEPREAINFVATLCRERWGRASMAFNSEKYREFHARLAELLVPRGQAYIVVMKVDGEPAAAKYDLIYGPKVFGFQVPWKSSLAPLAIGKIMQGKAFQRAIDQGLTEFDFLAGDAKYKLDWATGQRELVDFELVNPRSFRGRAFQWIRQLRNKLRDAFSRR